MPSPYVQDLFEAIRTDGRIEPRVFYMEQSPPDTYWGRVSLPDYASYLPGRGFQVAGIRTHVNPACGGRSPLGSPTWLSSPATPASPAIS